VSPDSPTVGVRNPLPGVIYPPEKRLRAWLAAGNLQKVGLTDALAHSFSLHASRPALFTPDESISYAELDDTTNRVAAALLRAGLEPCDRMLFQCGNSVELVYLFVGCLRAGIIPVCTLAAHRRQEIGFLGRFTDARAHAVQSANPGFDLEEFALGMRAELPAVAQIIAVSGNDTAAGTRPREGLARLSDLIAAEDPAEARDRVARIEHDPFQVAVFQLSGGTTGVPKVIPRMSNDYLLNARIAARALDYTPDDVIFNPMPMIHNACMIHFWLPALVSGAAFAIAGDLSPATWAQLFRTARPTMAGMIRALIPRFDEMIDLFPGALESLQKFWAPDAARLVRTRYGKTTHCLFGMTEGLSMFTLAGDPAEVVDTTVGRPLIPEDEVRVVRPGTDEVCEVDEEGELQCRGPYTLNGYYNSPEHNAVAFTKDGFYRTGDLVVRREIDGLTCYAFSGRTKDVVDRGTEKISCEEVEAAVAAHPDVEAVAVVGMPDPRLGERVCACIVPKSGCRAPDTGQLGKFLEDFGLAKFKWPERIETVDRLPLTKVGKFDKAALRQDISAKLRSENQEGESA